ncbi:hypothetical protein [Sphingomonas sp.]|uniref:hypothetical protein n=1 Tax=Sphingomonas sp. TaxID=28214 RepID=UPI002E0ECABA|nr:hypothetical protein [Sphingomonas sp.]
MTQALFFLPALVFLWVFIDAIRTGEGHRWSSINPKRRDQPVFFWIFATNWGLLSALSFLAAADIPATWLNAF